MSLEPTELARRVSGETGLEFSGSEGVDDERRRWIELNPAGHPISQTFTLRITLGWRRLDIVFRPGRFAGELLNAMRCTDRTGRRAFGSVLKVCTDAGADVAMAVNGSPQDPFADATWATEWRSMELRIKKGMLAINDGDETLDGPIVALWASRAAAAITAILPLEADTADEEDTWTEVSGLPEGAKTRIEVNRYERDRRNRAAALAIHGYDCKACDLDMGKRYGAVADGYIEVHHVTPVSEVGEDYFIDPATDLIPLCPNCHSVAHRRSPPYSVAEIRQMLGPN